MNFFTNFIDNVKKKKAEMDDRRRFLDEVEENAKPFRRAAYMKQAIHESVNEGIARAKIDAKKKMPQQGSSTSQSSLMEGINNPYKFLEGHPGFSQNQKPEFSPPKTNLTKLNNKKKK